MTHDELMAEACRLATESVENGWGGPFGAVIAKDGEIVARGQNRVLLTGDVTAHAEIETLRKAAAVLNPEAPSIAQSHRDESTLALVPRPEGSADVVEHRARMFMGHEIYISGAPCPMCMSAIYWARIDTVYFSGSLEDTSKIGFDDQFQYEDFKLPWEQRKNIKIFPNYEREVGLAAYRAWENKANRHPY
jgi:tRNA(Arg) A34 adenosine deaminase TadA